MKNILCVLLLIFAADVAQADDLSPAPHQQTQAVPNGRFEIMQSSLAARWTFRLDRYSGNVWQLVKTKDDDSTWEEMLVRGLPITSATKRRFQLFTSGLAARHTYLIDNDTGITWQMVTSKGANKDGTKYEIHLWQPFTN